MQSCATAVPENISYVVILLIHAASALLGLTALIAAGVTAAKVAGLSDLGAADESVRTYYQPGLNLLGRSLHLVPVTGIILVLASKGAVSFSNLWVELGIAAWLAAAFVAESQVYGAERRLQDALANPTAVPNWKVDARHIARSSVLCAVVVIAAAVVMVLQPGA